MKYLLDTHIFLWSLFEPNKLTEKVKEILLDESEEKVVSGINFWEISIKYSLGKLKLGNLNPNQLHDYAIESGYKIIDIRSDTLASYYQLPKKENHKDPFDRMLIWECITNNYTLISHDDKINQYISDGLRILE